MKLRYKIAGGTLAVIVLAVAGLAVAVSYDAPCEAAPAIPPGAETMQAVIYRCYGGPEEVLAVETVAKPVPADDELLVRVRAAGINPLDWHYMRGSPYLMRLSSGLGAPEDGRMGVDFAGTVEAVGSQVTEFAVGDRVFGGQNGAFAEYLTVGEDSAVAAMPDDLAFEPAGTVGIAGVTALQALRDHGRVEAGDRVLVNGASGGVGTFAVQIAKSMGAQVTGVCSTRNVGMVRALGADRVIDYTQENYLEGDERYDVVIDAVGNNSPQANARVVAAGGRIVIVGGLKGDWIAPFVRPLQALAYSPFVEADMGAMLAVLRQADLEYLAQLMAAGKVTPEVGRSYGLPEVPEAIAQSETGHARGKLVVRIE